MKNVGFVSHSREKSRGREEESNIISSWDDQLPEKPAAGTLPLCNDSLKEDITVQGREAGPHQEEYLLEQSLTNSPCWKPLAIPGHPGKTEVMNSESLGPKNMHSFIF